MSEFSIIDKYFRPLCSVGLDNDAAVLELPDGHDLVVTSDTLNEGTHFWWDEEPEYIAHKVLRVNLSDLAAMAADPLGYQLNIAFSGKPDEGWVQEFSAALKSDQGAFGISCSGGDTTTINGPLSISITAMGTVPKGAGLPRSAARDGDMICVLGHIGGALVGLEILRGAIDAADKSLFIDAYKKPYPYIRARHALRLYARAAIDVSDGFMADLGHICAASNLGADIDVQNIPFTKGALDYLPAEKLLTGGDDYALILAVSPDDVNGLRAELAPLGYDLAVAGRFTKDMAIRTNPHIEFKSLGWQHF